MPKQLLFSELEHGSRPFGRPKLRFKDILKKDLKIGSVLEAWCYYVHNRKEWRVSRITSARHTTKEDMKHTQNEGMLAVKGRRTVKYKLCYTRSRVQALIYFLFAMTSANG